MQTAAVALLVYGILVAAGGLMGYIQARSAASLASGAIAGLVLIGGAVLALGGRRAGLILDLVVAVLLVVFFAVRLATTGRPMPAVPSIVLSLVAIVVALAGLRRS